MSDIRIREAQMEDLAVLLKFEQGIIIVERPFDSTLKADPISYYDLKALILSSQASVIVGVTEDDEIVCSAYAKINPSKSYLKHDQYAYLGFMYVKPAYRGQGINQIIVDYLIEWARSKGLDEVKLDVYIDNLAAVRAYEKAGFKGQLLNMRRSI